MRVADLALLSGGSRGERMQRMVIIFDRGKKMMRLLARRGVRQGLVLVCRL